MVRLASALWDRPEIRGEHVLAWRLAKKEVATAPANKVWSIIRGPVGAAWAHLARVAAAWPKPFTIILLDERVDLLETPPKQVARLLKLHARRHYDRVLVTRLADVYEWNHELVLRRYSNGIDWDLLREALNGKGRTLSSEEKRSLLVLACGAFWPEARRWKEGGMLPTGTCLACCQEVGTTSHKINTCASVEVEVVWNNIAGRSIPQPPLEESLVPLAERALPPLIRGCKPVDTHFREGGFAGGTTGYIFGDGSGMGRKGQPPEVVTWAVAQVAGESSDSVQSRTADEALQICRGHCTGWFPSVPRGELCALIACLEEGCIPITYVGDCKTVIEGAAEGIHEGLTGSASLHADLWRRIKWLVEDHGPGVQFVKIKSHRSRDKAVYEDGSDFLWRGNEAADKGAKDLARSSWQAIKPVSDRQIAERAQLARWIDRAAICTSIAQRQLDRIKGPMIRTKRRGKTNVAGTCGGHTLGMREDGVTWCVQCHLVANTATSRKSLAGRPCQGEITSLIPSSHCLRRSSGVVWCIRCGCYMTRRPRALRNPCAGKPASAAAANVLRRLKGGLMPTTAAYLSAGRAPRHADEARLDHGDGCGGDNARRTSSRAPSVAATPSLGSEMAGTDSSVRQRVAVRGVDRSEGSHPTGQHGGARQGDVPEMHRPSRRRARSRTGEPGAAAASGDVRSDSIGADARPRDGAASPSGGVAASSSASGTAAQPDRDSVGLCTPAATSPWSRRIRIVAAGSSTECHLCGGPARSLCRGCERRLCVQCARIRKPCSDG